MCKKSQDLDFWRIFRFLTACFWWLVHQMDLMMHTGEDLSNFDCSTVVLVTFIIIYFVILHINGRLYALKAIFFNLGHSIDLMLHIMKVLIVLMIRQYYYSLPAHLMSIFWLFTASLIPLAIRYIHDQSIATSRRSTLVLACCP